MHIPCIMAKRIFFAGTILLTIACQPLTAQEPLPPPPLPDAGTLRVDVGLVNLYATVKTKKGVLLTTLEAADFEVFEDGKRQELRHFARETDRPLTLALLVDTSVSQQAVLPAEKETASQFLQQVLRPSDLAMLVTFDVNVDLLQDFTSQTEILHQSLQRARINTAVNLGPFPRSGRTGTLLFDAIYLTSREKLGQEVGRKAIILISDGYDAGSEVKEKKAIEAAHRGQIIIYAIGIADAQFYGGRSAVARGASTLKKLARETGGLALFPRNDAELQQAFDQIAAELRTQYLLSYSPTNRKRDGKFRKIKVKVKRRGTKVLARRGYYPARD